METQQHVSLYCRLAHVAVNNINTGRISAEMQQLFLLSIVTKMNVL